MSFCGWFIALMLISVTVARFGRTRKEEEEDSESASKQCLLLMLCSMAYAHLIGCFMKTFW